MQICYFTLNPIQLSELKDFHLAFFVGLVTVFLLLTYDFIKVIIHEWFVTPNHLVRILNGLR